MKQIKSVLKIGLLLLLTDLVTATPPQLTEIWNLHAGIKTVAAALGVLMITYAGIRWVVAESPQERDDAKKTIVYVIIGLIIVSLTKELVDAIYCQTLQSTTYGGGIC